MSKMVLADAEFFTNNVYQNNFKVLTDYKFRKRSVGPIETISKGKPEDKNMLGDKLFHNMRAFLIFGRILGILPTAGVFAHTHTALTFKLASAPAIINMIVTSMVGLSAALAILDSIYLSKSNALQIASSVQGTIFRIWALFSYVYFLFRADSFINIFKTWRKSPLSYPVEDKTFQRDSIIISTAIFLSAMLESTIIHLEYFPQFDHLSGQKHNSTSGVSTIEIYFWRSHPDWMKHVGYHPALAVLAFAAHKFVIACWNYVDAVIIIFARALYFRFRGLCEVAEEKLKAQKDLGQNVAHPVDSHAAADLQCWRNIVKDHDTLCSLLSAFEKFLSPLIFGSYMVNIYYICMQLIEGLTPDRVQNNLLHSIFAPVSFLTLLTRIFLISNMAARINIYAHAIGNALKKCPIELYDAEVARVDRHVTSGPDIGLTGLGCFTVTKPFLLSIINVVFTIEIVLLQGITMPSGACPGTS